MKYAVVTLIMTVGIGVASSFPGRSQPLSETSAETETELTREEMVTACIQERAETLPQLYTDVPPSHWAFKAVQTMAYCGAYRSATPPSLVEELLNSDSDR